MASAPGWLLAEVAQGLQRLMLLGLPGTPASETITGTAQVWADAFAHGRALDQRLDAPRIQAAFRAVAARVERFPPPRVVIDALPARPQPQALPAPQLTPAQIANNKQRIAALLRAIHRPMPQ